jgi:ABC-2 type transport system ATP-binding protein
MNGPGHLAGAVLLCQGGEQAGTDLGLRPMAGPAGQIAGAFDPGFRLVPGPATSPGPAGAAPTPAGGAARRPARHAYRCFVGGETVVDALPLCRERRGRHQLMLEVIDLAKRYGKVVALDGATFTARPGRIVGFLGPNGAGKTTTMRCIFGLARPDRGEVRWAGKEVDRAARLGFGYMPEQRGLYPRTRVAEQLSYFAQQHGLPGRTADQAANRWLDRMGLLDRRASKLEDLSHGNQQRVQLATALVHDPELLVLDEPFSGLDPLGIATMTEVIRERTSAGVGVMFSSHQLDLVEDICEDVVIIARGRIVAAGSIDELKRASGRQHLEVEVAGSDGSWLDGSGELTVLERVGERVKLLVERSVDLDELLARARSAGEVRRFAYEPPRLSELFMEAVTPPDTEDAIR